MSFRCLPRKGMSASTGTWTESQSCTSCGVNWKNQLTFPVSGSSANTQSEYKLSPARWSPFQSGPGFPVPQYVRFSSGSYAPVTQTEDPPVFQESPAHVPNLGSSGPV